MDGIGGEISSKIRAAIKAKLMEMGAYVDEELPDYVMVMVANKRSKSQMADDLQLFLGKSTEQFTNWLQQVLSKLQEVAIVGNKASTDTKKVQSRSAASDEVAHKAKSTSKPRCEQLAELEPEHAADRAGGHRSEKKRAAAGDGGAAAKRDRRSGSGSTSAAKAARTASTKMKIILMNSDDDDDEEDFINIKADAEAEALLKAELPMSAKQLKAAVGVTAEAVIAAASKRSGPSSAAERQQVATAADAVSARDVTAALAHSTSGARKVRPPVRRVVAAPSSAVVPAPTVVPVSAVVPASAVVVASAGAAAAKRSGAGEAGGGPAKRAAVVSGADVTARGGTAVKAALASRLGARPSGAPSVKDRLGTRVAITAAATTAVPAPPPRLASRLGVRKSAATESGTSATATGVRVADRLGTRPVGSTANGGLLAGPRVTDRLGARRADTDREGGASRKRAVEGGGDALPEVAVKRPAPESRLARRLRELAEGPSDASGGARVAHVPPNNVRQGGPISGRVDRRPAVNSRVVAAGARDAVAERHDREGEAAPAVALPSVVRVTPRPRLPARMQANKNLLLKAVAEAQRSVAAAAATAAAATSAAAVAADSPGDVRRRGGGWSARARLGKRSQTQEEVRPEVEVGEEQEEEEEEQQQQPEPEEEDEDEDYGENRAEDPEIPEALFTRGFLNRENFAVTVSNAPGTAGDADTEQQPDDGSRLACESRGGGRRRLVVTAEPGAPAVAAQQITVQLSPGGSHDGESSSEREDEETTEISRSAVTKDDTRGYDGHPVFEEAEEDTEVEEDDGPAAAVATVRPTVVTTVPHMDTEPVARPNPQFVVTLDGLDVSMFPNAGTDDDEGPSDAVRSVDRDVSKSDSGSGGTGTSTTAVSAGRATVVQRVEPRLRLGPMPLQNHQQQPQPHGAGEGLAAGGSCSTGVPAAKAAERCKYWPACRSGDKCVFHHPTRTCRVFPACKFGEKCLYIHPNCKFDAACTRKDCPYTHSSPRLGAPAGPARGLARPSSSGGGAAICRFFPGCSNPACRFLHPKACKYGRYCVKPGCTFQHDGVPTTDKLKWVCPFRA